MMTCSTAASRHRSGLRALATPPSNRWRCIAVNDKLTLARGAPLGFAALAGFALDQLPRFTTGEVGLNNMALAVNGVTDTPEIFAEAQAALAAALPEG